MKKIRAIIAILLSCSLLFSACTTVSSEKSHVDDMSVQETQVDDSLTGVEDQQDTNSSSEDSDDPDKENNDEIGTVEDEQIPDFYGMNDPALLQYVEDTVYAGLVRDFSSEDYVIGDVEAIYYSEDYLQEVAFNSKSNIYFGYTLAELDEQFQGQRYVFTLGDDGKTIVTPFEAYDDTYDRVIRNVAIGTGVILICVTVSVVTAGTGTAPTVSLIFAAAAKTGTEFALSSAVISGVASGVITGIQTKDFDKALKAAALNGSESFKWGAISGVIVGGATEAITLSRAAKVSKAIDELIADPNIPEWRRAELRALKQYGGSEQLSYIGGEEVPFSTPGATRPDVVRTVGDHLEAIEVKYYNLDSSASLNTLYSELEREVTARVANLPANSTQRVVLDVTGRNFSSETITTVTETIQSKLLNIYGSKIPVDIVGL